MAEENRGNRQGGGGSGRRRYYRGRPGDKPQGEAYGSGRASNSGAARGEGADSGGPRSDSRSRNVRRRRRNKNRRGSETNAGVVVAAERDVEYVPPLSVFIYTHTVRPDMRESYEFRSEHFSKVGHSLEEYGIDVSPLFDESARVDYGAAVAKAFADMGPEPEEIVADGVEVHGGDPAEEPSSADAPGANDDVPA